MAVARLQLLIQLVARDLDQHRQNVGRVRRSFRRRLIGRHGRPIISGRAAPDVGISRIACLAPEPADPPEAGSLKIDPTMASAETLISTVAAATAAVAAVVALILARKTLAEARATTAAQTDILAATQRLADRIDQVAVQVGGSTDVLKRLLIEVEAGRRLEHLGVSCHMCGSVAA